MGLSQDLMAQKHFEAWMIKAEHTGASRIPTTTGNRVFTETTHVTGLN